MIENLNSLVKQHADATIINNTSIPNERNEEAVQEASTAIENSLKTSLSGGNVKEVAVNVLQDQRKPILATIIVTRFAYGARDRVRPKSFVIRSSIVIASKTKSARCPKYQDCRRDRLYPYP